MKDDRNQIAARISTMLQTQHLRKVFFDQRGPQAQSLLDLLQELLDNLPLPDTRSHLVTVLVRLSRESGLYPERLLLEDVQIQSLFPLAGGSYGDVWKGSLDGRVVAVKMMRTYHTQDERLFKTFAKEAVLWARLSNPYVLPLLGVYCIFEPIHRVCLVSPWMDNRNLSQYLEEHPETNRLSLIQDVALGLDYLHSFEPPVIHGDLKGVNILITAERRACVADFGLCILVQNTKIQCTMSSSAHSAGTFHWMAPELLQVEEGTESIRKTCSSDVYAFGCVCFEIYDGKPPFSKLPRPTHTSLDDNIWTLIQRCLVTDPEARPNMKQITQKLKCHPDVQSHRTHFLG
ncbi:kinase-like domain-containing protein [Hygrophoropsis aurantiaca]|uniref:Kinase-like domain-containing protein n=1 Tax=Hygrophoropsis aurantiaca TaxID=72124 RepID=A0ACB8ABP4_9AGAM|nr:kinase-like domain-containing protein [Hygrophoropsis aurantiaca]